MLKRSIAVVGISAVVAIFLVFAFTPGIYANATSQQNSYTLSFSPGTYNPSGCGGTGCWVVSPGPVTIQACTNDKAVNMISISGFTSSGAPGFFAVSGTPTSGCFSTTQTFTAGQTWQIQVLFYHHTVTHIHGAAFATVLVTPQFPAGAILAALAPIAAVLGYVKFRKPAFPKIKA